MARASLRPGSSGSFPRRWPERTKPYPGLYAVVTVRAVGALGEDGIKFVRAISTEREAGAMAACAGNLGSRLKDIYDLREPYELEAAVPKQSAVG